MSDPANPSPPDLVAAADRCVACGLCLPHCPSYRVDPVEGESPRGRISLIRGWASGALPAGPALQAHLDHCLGCLNCQSACPAQVDYQQLLTGARRALPPRQTRVSRLARWLVAGPTRLRWANAAIRLAIRSRAARWSWPRALRQRLAGLPSAANPPASSPPSDTWLFAGCLSAPLDDAARAAAQALLRRLGLSTHDDRDSGCCGLMAQMAGDSAAADRLAAHLRQRLREAGVRQLVGVSSGCQGRLQDILATAHQAPEPVTGPAETVPESSPLAWPAWLRRFAQRMRQRSASRRPQVSSASATPAAVHGIDLANLLEQRLADHQATFVGTGEAVLYFEPCSQRAHARPGAWPRLLARIPGLQLRSLSNAPSCCGAAGTHHLDHPEQSAALRDELVAAIRASGARRLLTNNAGCAQYLRAGLAASGAAIEVQHPVELLAESLVAADPTRTSERLRDLA